MSLKNMKKKNPKSFGKKSWKIAKFFVYLGYPFNYRLN